MPERVYRTTCYGYLNNETDKAYLFYFKPEVSDGITGNHWVPRTLGELDDGMNGLKTMTIPEWFATRLRRENPVQ